MHPATLPTQSDRRKPADNHWSQRASHLERRPPRKRPRQYPRPDPWRSSRVSSLHPCPLPEHLNWARRRGSKRGSCPDEGFSAPSHPTSFSGSRFLSGHPSQRTCHREIGSPHLPLQLENQRSTTASSCAFLHPKIQLHQIHS